MIVDLAGLGPATARLPANRGGYSEKPPGRGDPGRKGRRARSRETPRSHDPKRTQGKESRNPQKSRPKRTQPPKRTQGQVQKPLEVTAEKDPGQGVQKPREVTAEKDPAGQGVEKPTAEKDPAGQGVEKPTAERGPSRARSRETPGAGRARRSPEGCCRKQLVSWLLTSLTGHDQGNGSGTGEPSVIEQALRRPVRWTSNSCSRASLRRSMAPRRTTKPVLRVQLQHKKSPSAPTTPSTPAKSTAAAPSTPAKSMSQRPAKTMPRPSPDEAPCRDRARCRSRICYVRYILIYLLGIIK